MIVSDTSENACRIRSAVGLSVTLCLFVGCKPGRPACACSRDRRRTNSVTVSTRTPSVSRYVRPSMCSLSFDKQRCDLDTALEALEDALNAVCVTRAQDRIRQRQPRVPRSGDKGLPAKTLAPLGDTVFLASDL